MATDPVDAIPSASLILLRDDPFEVLMLLRHERSSFAPSAWVFPGGVLEAEDHRLATQIADGSTAAALRIAALRETFEETGVWLGTPLSDAEKRREQLLRGAVSFEELSHEATPGLDRLVLTSRWITPEGLPKRFDTWFFLAVADQDVVATAEQSEGVEVQWISPSEALARNAAGGLQMVFPTIRNLEAISGYAGSRSLIEARRGAEIEPVMPILVNGRPALR